MMPTLVARSWQRNVIPLLMIRNFKNGEFSPELIGSVLENPTYRNNLVESLVQLAKDKEGMVESVLILNLFPPREEMILPYF